jgi:hypothetical protein
MSCILTATNILKDYAASHFRAEPILNKLYTITFPKLLKVTVTTRREQRARGCAGLMISGVRGERK